MRAGWVVSLIGHVGFVIMTMLAWSVTTPMRTGTTAVVPVEIVDVAAEANVRALAEDVPDDAEETVTEETNAVEEPRPAPSPTPTPTPRRPQPNNDFSLEDVTNLFSQEQRRRREDGDTSDRTQPGVGPGTEERTSLEARIAGITRQELNRCWRSTADMPEPERLVVVLSVRLNRDGSLNGQPRVLRPTNYTFDPLMNEAVNRALRAVRTCEPIERLPSDPIVGEHFDLWRDQEVTFGLRQ